VPFYYCPQCGGQLRISPEYFAGQMTEY
jgi:hypothetical protein